MLIYLLSELLCWLSELHYVTPSSKQALPTLVFITLGAWAKAIILKYSAMLADKI